MKGLAVSVALATWIGASGCDGCRAAASAEAALAEAPSGARTSAPIATRDTSDKMPAPAVARASAPARELTWVYEQTPVGPLHVVLSVPNGPEERRYPVLIAMHGRGEALKGSERGARAWIDDYWLDRGLERVARPPLRGSDFLGSADAERLRRMNDSLRSEPYQGLIIVMPYTPDMLRGPQPFEAALPLATFLVDELLPRVYRETPALGSPPSTGIDGVSLGGRAALSVGLERPEAFGAVASLQAAFGTEDARKIAERARLARARNPGLKLRLLTSDGDFFLDAHRAISAALSDMRVEHEFLIVAGPHDYEFNRGPGLFEMLLFHDRVLRGKSAP